ncbi:MAG: ergothioneine biosynthesis protein EgtB [Reyranella sp.]|uniref:selenoneine synthase SenA n=1 Tax=Reyranella sp. TaxID=1929291 RepID=UPI0012272924|nr:selenoneine synthase SenA [Reyranella sp.]TAJ36955.1 MAG: ergothioneine biosynthesis protein EgtB [Reyranella sp.]
MDHTPHDRAHERRPTSGVSAVELVAQLREARHRTRRLTEELSSRELMGPQIAIVNPVLWEIGHVGWFHEYWTLRHIHGRAPLIERGDRLWDSSAVAHATRWQLDLPDRAGTFGYLADVLARQEDRLGGTIDEDARYFYELALRHEDMHVEALTYSRQTLSYAAPRELGDARRPAAGALPGDVAVPGGTWRLGSTAADGFVFDNEKWAHETALAPFRIARAAVTNAEFAAFIEAGGYGTRELWSDAGWTWRQSRNAERPVYWLPKRDGVWTVRRYRAIEELAPHQPVVFVTWFEAEAWCRWAGRRLPSEAEWEAAAVGEPAGNGARLAAARRRWPWGDASPTPAHANLDYVFDGPVDVAACADGDSAFGCRQMIGNVWEWTASDFLPFAGFAADPYKDYSQPWFGTRKVLRGGCWATSARIARPAYRNFFTPDRNDVLAGFRTCALI